MTTAISPGVGRGILDDRYQGLLERGLHPTGLRTRLDRVIQDLIEGVARVNWTGELDDGDQTGSASRPRPPRIREALIREIESRGIAR